MILLLIIPPVLWSQNYKYTNLSKFNYNLQHCNPWLNILPLKSSRSYLVMKLLWSTLITRTCDPCFEYDLYGIYVSEYTNVKYDYINYPLPCKKTNWSAIIVNDHWHVTLTKHTNIHCQKKTRGNNCSNIQLVQKTSIS